MSLAAWIFVAVYFVFCVLDAVFYGLAKYPERCKHGRTLLPGGGFYAFFKYGRNR
jgi:hypothetical protein